jgi:hypothetical protein
MNYNQLNTSEGGLAVTVTFSSEEINQMGIDPWVLAQITQSMAQPKISKKLFSLGILAQVLEDKSDKK